MIAICRRRAFIVIVLLLVFVSILGSYYIGYSQGREALATRCLSLNPLLQSMTDKELSNFSQELASLDSNAKRLLLSIIKSDVDFKRMFSALEEDGHSPLAHRLLQEKIKVDLEKAEQTQGPVEPASVMALMLLLEGEWRDELSDRQCEELIENIALQAATSPLTFHGLATRLAEAEEESITPAMAILLSRCARFNYQYDRAAKWANYGIIALQRAQKENNQNTPDRMRQEMLRTLKDNLLLSSYLNTNYEAIVSNSR